MGMASACSDLYLRVLEWACDGVIVEPVRFFGVVVGTLAASFLAAAARPVRQRLWLLLTTLAAFLTSGWSASRRLAAARAAVSPQGRGPWLAVKPRVPPDYALRMQSAIGSMPVIVCANLKGGVGKTTLTANLAASFAKKKQGQKPVPAIDLDFQGSLSSMLFAGTHWRPNNGEESPASQSISGAQTKDFLVTHSRPAMWPADPESERPVVQVIQRLEGVSAFYDLAEVEDRLRLLWSIADEERDIRYFLYELLHNDSLRNKFSMVLIDAPPRLTTACIQALVASTHLVIPTIADELSAEAVAYFGNQLIRYEELWPHLAVLGIIGTMVDFKQTHQQPALTGAGDRLQRALAGCHGRLDAVRKAGMRFEFPPERCVPGRASLGRTAGKGIAYAALGYDKEGREIRGIFDEVADEIMNRMKVCES
jgi:chromosome partitioning protein